MSNQEGSEYDRLFYPFLFAGGQANIDDVLAQVRHSTEQKCAEIMALRQQTLTQCADQIIAAGTAMGQAFTAGATLWAFGNGGSTTDAQDLVVDLLRPPLPGYRPLPAIALTSDSAVVTAMANDIGFDTIFARQLIAFGRPGDIAFGISTSGTSSNVLVALEQAKKQGLLTVALAGAAGGKLAHSAAVDFCLVAPSDYTPRIQEAHATIYHTLLAVVQHILADSLTRGAPDEICR